MEIWGKKTASLLVWFTRTRAHTHTAAQLSEQADSPFLLGDDQDVVEEEEVDLLPRRPPEEDPAVLHEGRQLAALHHPPGGGDQRERLREQEPRKT